MTFHHLSESKPKCRKPINCVWCWEIIEKGETYCRYVGVFDGEFQSNAVHMECKTAMDRSDYLFLQDGFTPGDQERGVAIKCRE